MIRFSGEDINGGIYQLTIGDQVNPSFSEYGRATVRGTRMTLQPRISSQALTEREAEWELIESSVADVLAIDDPVYGYFSYVRVR
jgi:hypothetical protein